MPSESERYDASNAQLAAAEAARAATAAQAAATAANAANTAAVAAASSSAAAIGVVNSQLNNMTGTLTEIKEVLKAQGEQLGKLAVIEERFVSLSKTVDRAFTAIGDITRIQGERAAVNDNAIASVRAELETHRAKMSRWTYTVSGVMGAVTVMWAVFGAYFSDTIKTAIDITSAYRYGVQVVPRAPLLPPATLVPPRNP